MHAKEIAHTGALLSNFSKGLLFLDNYLKIVLHFLLSQMTILYSNRVKFEILYKVDIHFFRFKNFLVTNLWLRSNAGISLVSVNSAFLLLRTLIPTEPADRKLSKIETLRLASSYISHLGIQLIAGNWIHTQIYISLSFITRNYPGSMEQPCLKHKGPVPGYDTSNPRPVCTFCLSSMKKLVRIRDFVW